MTENTGAESKSETTETTETEKETETTEAAETESGSEATEATGTESKKNRLIVPQPLQVLAEGDKFGREDEHIKPAKLIESFAGDAKNPAYDKYGAEVCNSDGDVLYEYITYLYYKKGELFASKLYWKYPDREEVLLQDMEIIRLTSEIPEKRINLKKGCEVFKAGIGDIDDMLDHQVLLYKVGKENKDA